jgi:isoleucyl-tRNA synthetase
VREIVRILQDGRKRAGLEVSDRIEVTFDSTDGAVLDVFASYGDAIADEVLAVKMSRDEGLEGVTVDTPTFSYSIAKA